MCPSKVGLAACAPVHLGWKNGFVEECNRCDEKNTCSCFFTTGRPRFSRGVRAITSLSPEFTPWRVSRQKIGRMTMKIHNGLLIAIAIVCSLSLGPAFAKTAKDCTAEWRADKAGMQARGVTEKAYVEQCRGGAEPTAAAPAAKPAETASPAAPRQTTATGSKTAKDCTAEWRADKAGMQARGVTEKAYVEQCKTGGAVPSATAPEPKPTATAPTPPPSRPAPTATEAAPAPAPQKPAATTTAAPIPAPAQQTSAPKGSASATLEAGQFVDEASAKAR